MPNSSLHVLTAALASVLLCWVPPPSTASTHTGCDAPAPFESDGLQTYCETRTVTLSSDKAVRVAARPSGDIQVRGSRRPDVLAEAHIWVRSQSQADARALAEHVHLRTDGTLRADTPPTTGATRVEVSFRLRVPHDSDLDLSAMRGDIEVHDVSGNIRYETREGDVRLDGLGGDVKGLTLDGSAHIRLSSGMWAGEGLDIDVERGDIRVDLPSDFRNTLDVETQDGLLRSPFYDPYASVPQPQGHRFTMGGHRSGPTVRAVTSQGDVVVREL